MSSHPDAPRIIQSNDVASIVIQQATEHAPGLFVPLDLRYGIADALWAAGYRKDSLTVRTVEELDVLPVGSVLLIIGGEDHPVAAMKNTSYNFPAPDGDAWWVTGFDEPDGWSSEYLLTVYEEAEITVLYRPAASIEQTEAE